MSKYKFLCMPVYFYCVGYVKCKYEPLKILNIIYIHK